MGWGTSARPPFSSHSTLLARLDLGHLDDGLSFARSDAEPHADSAGGGAIGPDLSVGHADCGRQDRQPAGHLYAACPGRRPATDLRRVLTELRYRVSYR